MSERRLLRRRSRVDVAAPPPEETQEARHSRALSVAHAVSKAAGLRPGWAHEDALKRALEEANMKITDINIVDRWGGRVRYQAIAEPVVGEHVDVEKPVVDATAVSTLRWTRIAVFVAVVGVIGLPTAVIRSGGGGRASKASPTSESAVVAVSTPAGATVSGAAGGTPVIARLPNGASIDISCVEAVAGTSGWARIGRGTLSGRWITVADLRGSTGGDAASVAAGAVRCGVPVKPAVGN